MRSIIFTVTAGLLACLARPAGAYCADPSAQQPSASPFVDIEQRLDRLEQQIQLIQQHVGMRGGLPSSARIDNGSQREQPGEDHLGRIEAEARRLNERVDRVERQLDGAAGSSRVLPPPTQGRLIVRNFTGVPYYLSVNKVLHYVQPGRTDIWVPYQIVEAYLPSHESPKLLGMSLWKWTGRDYEMPLEIRN
jgi:hypothetical protein